MESAIFGTNRAPLTSSSILYQHYYIRKTGNEHYCHSLFSFSIYGSGFPAIRSESTARSIYILKSPHQFLQHICLA